MDDYFGDDVFAMYFDTCLRKEWIRKKGQTEEEIEMEPMIPWHKWEKWNLVHSSYLSLSNDCIIKDVLHLEGRCELLHFTPESHATLLQQLHGHVTLKGNNWRAAQWFFLLHSKNTKEHDFIIYNAVRHLPGNLCSWLRSRRRFSPVK